MSFPGAKIILASLVVIAAVSYVTCVEDETVIPTTDPSVTTSQQTQPKDSRIINTRGKARATNTNSEVRIKKKKEKAQKTGFAAGVTSVIFAGWKHFLLPFLMGVTLKVSTLVPVVLMTMTLIGGVALLVSKMALLMATLTAGHQYFSKGGHGSHHHVHQPDFFTAQVLPIPSLDHGGHSSASEQYQQFAASSANSNSYPTGYSGSYSSYPNQYYKKVVYKRR